MVTVSLFPLGVGFSHKDISANPKNSFMPTIQHRDSLIPFCTKPIKTKRFFRLLRTVRNNDQHNVIKHLFPID